MVKFTRRIHCRLFGHRPMLFNLTSTIGGVTAISPCQRCGDYVEELAYTVEVLGVGDWPA